MRGVDDCRLFTGQRRGEILRLIRQRGTVSVGELAGQFHVSGTTIRLDLACLEKAGGITRTHGGAMLNELSFHEPLISERVHEREKAAIALRALEHIESNDVLLLDTGTTMVALARALILSSFTKLTVYSNDLDVLRILEEKESWDLFLLGGKVRNGFHYTCGPRMIKDLANLHFKKAFIATSAISYQAGLTVSNPDLALLKSAMIASAETVCLLADSSKLHRVDFQKFAGFDDIDILITDSGISREDLTALKERVKTFEIAECGAGERPAAARGPE